MNRNRHKRRKMVRWRNGVQFCGIKRFSPLRRRCCIYAFDTRLEVRRRFRRGDAYMSKIP